MENFIPKISQTKNDFSEEQSVLCIKRILSGHNVVTNISERDKTPNIDGYIDLLDEYKRILGKITVQVKTYPVSDKGKAKYKIPASLLGYARRIKGEVVLLLVADCEVNRIYWKYIESAYINECLNKGIQDSYTYYFTDSEILTSHNVDETIKYWQFLYDEKIKQIKDLKNIIQNKIDDAA
jgi:hypothetical protein